jgi:hypothetical protein
VISIRSKSKPTTNLIKNNNKVKFYRKKSSDNAKGIILKKLQILEISGKGAMWKNGRLI